MTIAAALLLASLQASARADRRAVDVGGSVNVEVRITGSNLARANVERPRAPSGLEIGEAQGPSLKRTIVSINGRQTQNETLVYTFEITPTRAGTFTVPPFLVSSGSETTTTDPFVISATGSFDPGKYAFVETRVDTRARYVGEPIRVDLVAGLEQDWVDRLVEGETSLNAPWITDGLGNGALAEPEGVPAPNAPGAITMRMPSGQGVSMRPGHEKRGDTSWATWSLRRSFVPTRPGPVSIGPTTFRAVIATRIERDIIFNTPMAAETRLAAVDAAPIAIDVKPLPDAGRPDDFSGLVGRLSLAVEASTRQVKVGETVRVTVRVSGDGNVASTPLPRPEIPGFKRFGAVEDVDVAGDDVSRTLTLDLAPVSTDVTEIPPFRVSVFDTASGTYRTLSSAPIKLKVLPGARVSAIADTPAPTPTNEPHREATPEPTPGRSDSLAATARDVAPWVALFALPPLAIGGWLLVRRRRQAPKPKPARRSIAHRRLSDALAALPRDPRDGAAGVALALGRFLADLTERPPESFVGAELDAALAPFVPDAKLRREVQQLVEEAEHAAFGGRSADVRALAARAEALAGPLEAATTRFH